MQRIEKTEYDVQEEPIVLSKSLLDKLLSQNNSSTLISLYSFYYYTAKWQHTNQPKATDQFCMNALKIGYDRFLEAKNTLISLGLIEKIMVKNQAGKITGWFIKVNFIWTKTRTRFYQNKEIHEVVKNQNKVLPEQGNQGINALNSNNINALNSNNLSLKLKKITPSQFSNFWKIYPKKPDKGKALTAWNKLCSKKDRPTWFEIKSAIIAQKKTDRWQESKYIPNPTTWLNQNRWLDDPKEMKNINRESNQTTKGSQMFGEKIEYKKPVTIITIKHEKSRNME